MSGVLLSPRTVASHLYRLYPKFGIAGTGDGFFIRDHDIAVKAITTAGGEGR